MLHGSARRTNPGERRIFITRYGPSDFRDRYGYAKSPELLARLTEQRRRMTCPGGKKLSRLKLGRRTGHADAQPKSGAT